MTWARFLADSVWTKKSIELHPWSPGGKSMRRRWSLLVRQMQLNLHPGIESDLGLNENFTECYYWECCAIFDYEKMQL